MIELNCSYEESKKILELGYDFSKVCTKFDGGEIQPYFGVLGHDLDGGYCIALRQFYQPETFIIKKDTQLKDCFTPIIPKAALEDCLPDYLLQKGCNRHFSLFYHVRKFMGELYWANSRDESLTENWFSPYEAFLWCHENYPEELKKKFDEVMG